MYFPYQTLCGHVYWEQHAANRILCQNLVKIDEPADMGPNHVTVSPVNYVGCLSIAVVHILSAMENKNV